ncbi:hypothetical protein BDN71DRAFT_1505317 [Pleurotus eryngii]|uniref:Proteophosphoglycan ppg4 n=1 Tax=Pleurotus eryngii TaxID=5323 RepID=A0A9P6A263_PLEER|nr:hypothetical protein BDN71DRAFT_1505317 [Pleurotus eryngii]
MARRQHSQQPHSASLDFPDVPPVPPIPPEILSMLPSSGSSNSTGSNSKSKSGSPTSPSRRGEQARASTSPVSPTSPMSQPQPSSSPVSPTSPQSGPSPSNLNTSHSTGSGNNDALAREDSSQAHARTPSSDYYPSWLPRRPLAPPPPASTTTTLALRRTPLPFQDSEDGEVGPYGEITDAEMEGGAHRDDEGDIEEVGRTNGEGEPSSSPSETESVFVRNLSGRRPTPRSVRIVSLPHSPAGASPRNPSALQPSPVIPRGAPVIPAESAHRLPFHKRVWSRATGAFSHRRQTSRPGLPSDFSPPLPATPSAPVTPSKPRPASLPTSPRHAPPQPLSRPPNRTGITPTFTHPALDLKLLRSPSLWFKLFYRLWPFLVLAHVPIQIWLDYTAIWVLISVSRHPSEPISGISTNSSRSWSLATAAYLFCSAVWLFGIVMMYEGIYCFVRRWRIKRPLVLPIYLSSPAFNYAVMTSYSTFCFLMQIRWGSIAPAPSSQPASLSRSAQSTGSRHPNDPSDPTTIVPEKELVAVSALPSSSEYGGWKQFIAESCWFYSQNLPTVSMLVPRAGLVLALLFTFSSVQSVTTGTASNPATPRDPTYFRVQDGSLTAYARGVLMANGIWAAWRILLVLFSCPSFRRIGLWFLSGHLCGGICGPRYRWEEEEYGYGNEKTFLDEKAAYPYSFHLETPTGLSPRSYPMPQTPTVNMNMNVPSSPAVPSRISAARDAYAFHDDVFDSAARKRQERGPGLPWKWRDLTKLRVAETWDFCFVAVAPLTKKRGDIGKERQRADVERGVESGEGGFDGIERVLAAVGFPSSPAPARRGVLRDDLFITPEVEQAQGVSGQAVLVGLEVEDTDEGRRRAKGSVGEEAEKTESTSQGSSSRKKKGRGKRRELQVSPYPFAGAGAHISSEDEPVPFPPSPGLSHSATEDDDEVKSSEVDDPSSPSSSSRVVSSSSDARTSSSARRQTLSSERASESMSSLGQPVNSRYPFQFRSPHPPRHATAHHSHSESQSTGPSSNARSGRSYMSASTGNRESTDSSRPRYSLSDASASASVSLASPLGSPTGPAAGRRNRQSLGTESAMSGSGVIPMPPRHPRGRGGRARAGSIPSNLGEAQVLSYYSSALGSPVSPDMENPPPSPTQSLPPPSDDEEEKDLQGAADPSKEDVHDVEDEGAHGAESEDVVGLLGQPTTGGLSPKSSFTALRHRGSSTLSLTAQLQQHRSRRSGSRSATNSISGQSSSGSSPRSRAGSSSRSRAGSMISVHVRSRTQSLLHGLGAASHSSLELVHATFGGRSRANSSMARLEEDAGGESDDIQSGRPSMTRERGWAERAQREDAQTHSRSGSGNISDAVMSSVSGSTSAGTSGGENYTFGHPLRTQWHDPEHLESPAGHGQPSPIPESPRAESPTTSGGALNVPHQVEARSSHTSLMTASSPPSVDEGTMSYLTPRQHSEEPDDHPRSRNLSMSLPIPIPGRRVAEHEQIPGSVGMISTADQSFVTAPATITGHTTDSGEARTVSSWGGGGAAGHGPRDLSQPGAWGPA